MTDSTYVGPRATNLEHGQTSTNITKVVLKKNDETSYTATLSPDNGATLNVECPWATQTMANNILNNVKTFTFTPYQASSASVDLAAEPGDGVTVGGVYSVLGEIDTDSDGNSNISARQTGEMESEYPYLTSNEKAVMAAKARAEAAMERADDAYGYADDAYDRATAAYNMADDVDDLVSPWVYNPSATTPKIDGTMIQAGTIRASYLQGGEVDLLTSTELTAGSITITGSSSSSYAIDISSGGALRLGADNGAVYISDGSGAAFGLSGGTCWSHNDLAPNSNGSYDLGTSSWKWDTVYATTGTIQTSDRQVKREINYDLSNYDQFISKLKPVSFKFNDGHRTHIGFISQDIETALAESDIDTEDFAGFVKSRAEEGSPVEYHYALRYDEFIALQQYQIQKLEERIKALEDRLNG